MRVQIKGGGRNIKITLPTRMIFNKAVVRVASRTGRKYVSETMEHIPPEALEALFTELRRIKKRYGCWNLVDIVSADGKIVKISL